MLHYLTLVVYSVFSWIAFLLTILATLGILSPRAETRTKSWIRTIAPPIVVVLFFLGQYQAYSEVKKDLLLARKRIETHVYYGCGRPGPQGPIYVPELNLAVAPGNVMESAHGISILFAVPVDPSQSIQAAFDSPAFEQDPERAVKWVKIPVPKDVPTSVELPGIGKIRVQLEEWCQWGTGSSGDADGMIVTLTREPD